jgi:hypothetical protein
MGMANRALANVLVWGAIIVFAFLYWPVALALAALWLGAMWLRRDRHCDLCRAVLSRTAYRITADGKRASVCPMCYENIHRRRSKTAVQEMVQNGRL